MSEKRSQDAFATGVRADLNRNLAEHDLEDWIFSQAQPMDGMTVLDIGCGHGKQLFRLAHALSSDSSLFGIDISSDAVASVNEQAKDLPNVQARQMEIDTCMDHWEPASMDLILSTYAFYYATDMVAVLKGLRNLLRPHGSIFISGPGRGTNREIIDIINCAAGSNNPISPIDDFITSSQIQSANQSYSSVKTVRLENKIHFPHTEDVMKWWRQHSSYIKELDIIVSQAVAETVTQDGRFSMTKNVLGVKLNA